MRSSASLDQKEGERRNPLKPFGVKPPTVYLLVRTNEFSIEHQHLAALGSEAHSKECESPRLMTQ